MHLTLNTERSFDPSFGFDILADAVTLLCDCVIKQDFGFGLLKLTNCLTLHNCRQLRKINGQRERREPPGADSVTSSLSGEWTTEFCCRSQFPSDEQNTVLQSLGKLLDELLCEWRPIPEFESQIGESPRGIVFPFINRL